jgi:curved DNA-binding protein CbpA
MESSQFTDYYEILEISPNANSGTIERMFRYLAQRYHPDNRETGDRVRFDLVIEAHGTLKDPIKRAQYDVRYKDYTDFHWKLAQEANELGVERDVDIQKQLLTLLHAKCRRDASHPGVGIVELERLLDCPYERLEFHIWYLKGKHWIAMTEDGMFAITVEGVDRVNSEYNLKSTSKFITDQHKKD